MWIIRLIKKTPGGQENMYLYTFSYRTYYSILYFRLNNHMLEIIVLGEVWPDKCQSDIKSKETKTNECGC
jgi:hypothetical protein